MFPDSGLARCRSRSGMTTTSGLSARDKQQRAFRFLEQSRGRVAEKQLVARTAADTHHHEIVVAPLELAENGLIRGALSEDRGADAHVVAVSNRHDILEDCLLVTAGPDAATHAAPDGRAHRNVEYGHRRFCRARKRDGDLGRTA